MSRKLAKIKLNKLGYEKIRFRISPVFIVKLLDSQYNIGGNVTRGLRLVLFLYIVRLQVHNILL